MGGQPCYWKILHDGARLSSGAEDMLDLVQQEDFEIPDEVGYKVVSHLIEAETSLGRATKMLLEANGWDEQWPPELTFKE